MKKTLLSIIYFLACIFSIHAQALYSTTVNGGNEGRGTIIKFLPATNNLTVAKFFEGSDNGFYPLGSLLQATDGKIYGMTNRGGSSDYGVIFSFDPFCFTYTKLKDFDGTNGATPYGSLIRASDGKLYGMTYFGGSSNGGVIFSFDPSSSTYTKLKDFDGVNGFNPADRLLQASDGKLYGMTYQGGSNGRGVIFSFDPSSSVYTKLKDFDNINGSSPYGSLIQASDGKLYGMTYQGGSRSVGVIFSFDLSSSTITKLKDFDGINGALPLGSLIQASDGKLYGMTNDEGGSSGFGVIFSFDPSSSIYTKLHDFDGANGAYPNGNLMQASDGKLYGMTPRGGSRVGVIFSFDLSSSTYTKLQDFDVTNGAYPYYGSAFIEVKEYIAGINCDGGYCSTKGICSDKGFIKNVFACYSFNNTTGCTGYGDYTAKGVNTAAGRLLGFSVTPGYNSSTYQPLVYIRTWIDWNGDGDFTDGGELVFAPFNPVNVKAKFWIRVPMGTSAGRKRMRVAVSADKNISSCGTIANGEVEDYSINILAARFAVPDARPDAFDEAGETFTIYPNPVKHKMIIERSGYDEVKANNAPAFMVVTNANGKTLMQTRLANLVQAVDVSKLPSGVYFVTIINGNNKTTNKIIINR